jgi:formylglycine-generating enzyme required for sulfatase activity
MYRKFLMHLIIVLYGLSFSAIAQPEGMVTIERGTFMPFYSSTEDSTTVESFYMDTHPVTNADFLEFVKENEKWRRSQVKSVFADEDYLRHWKGELELGKVNPNAPVTNVTWFAARAYAKWKGKRLPTQDGWECVASASASKPLASRDKEFVQQILNWYSRPNPEQMPPVGSGEPNYHGVYNMHGLIWEWVQDFNTVFVSGESRADQGELKQFFCAAGSSAASDSDKGNYAAFLRYAFRGSLEADFSVGNLGFRCARDKD